MKVLFVLHYPPPVHGAAVIGSFIRDSEIINSGFDCRFINLGISSSLADINRNIPGKIRRYLFLLWQMKKQLLLFRPDICYFTPTSAGNGFYKDVPLIFLAKLFRVKTIFHFHNKGISKKQDRFFDNLLYRFVFRNSHVILLSKLLYPDIQKYVPEERVFYCPNGIPDLTKEKLQDPGQAPGVPEPEDGQVEKADLPPMINDPFDSKRETRLLFISHLIGSKGVLILIEACSLLKERSVEFHCTIAGGNAELSKEELEEFIREKGLSSLTTVAGPVHNEVKAELLKKTDIFVHPSYNDCMPLIILEAMQFSLPVVSTFEGAIPDMVVDGETGFLVPQHDAAALAGKLEVLIRNPEIRQQMGRNGREKYEKGFTLEKFEVRLTEILTEVAGK